MEIHAGERKEAKGRAALLFGIVAALGVGLFHYRAPFLLADDLSVLIPYISVVIGAVFLAASLSGWYFQETGLIELIAAPMLVVIGAALMAGQFYVLYVLWTSPPPASLTESMAFGVVASGVYLYLSAPIVIPMATIASYALWRRYRFADIHEPD